MHIPKKIWIPALVLMLLAAVGLAARANAAQTANPQYQTGEVHSCTTGGYAGVTTLDGGYDWFYGGSGGPGYPTNQIGVVRSFTTGGRADVTSSDGGLIWNFDPNGRGLFCSSP